MPKRPVDKQEAVAAFYAQRDVDVSYYSVLWHIFNVGHLMETDLERICRKHGLSFADLHLLSAVRVDGLSRQRATDLAQLLNVSNAVLSIRVRKLEEKGLLTRTPAATDRRAIQLQLTAAGAAMADAIGADIAAHSHFVRCVQRLPAQDREALARIMGELHNELDREFISAGRGKL